MTELLKRLHLWIGLFNFTALIVFACTGIFVTLPRTAGPNPIVRTLDYEAPAGFSDQEVADHLHATLALPLVGPIPEWAVHRNEQNLLVLEFNGPNGVHRATLLEDVGKVRIEHARSSLGEFLDTMHATALSHSSPDLRVRLWAIYVDLSIFSLMFMTATGVWLWLASRPKLWWARASFGAGAGLFLLLWFVTR
jgi:hypothetical protein